MNIYIFSGPTLRPTDGRKILDATFLPPVSQGDVYRVALKKPFAIGIIDGYFDRVPAVWHKEILWAMAEGIHVFGAASIGALRAAELAPFGMEGIGWIYEAFRDGVLEDDDEVAVIHSETFAPLSEAMVNIRRTLEKAQSQGILGSSTHSSLIDIAKRLFYPERTYKALLHQGRKLGLPRQELSLFEQWWPTNRIDQKYDDAIVMLQSIRDEVRRNHPRKPAAYIFEPTYAWEQLRHEAGVVKIRSSSTQAVFTDAILDELRLNPTTYMAATDWCLARILVREPVSLNHIEGDETSLLETVAWFRERMNLKSSGDVERWLLRQHLDSDALLHLMQREEQIQVAKSVLAEQINRLLPSYLQLAGQYSRLTERAAHKHRILSKIGMENPTPDDIGLTDERLLRWYSRDRFKKGPTMSSRFFARRSGFSDGESLLRAVRREKCYLMHVGKEDKAKQPSPPVTKKHTGASTKRILMP